MNIKKTAASFLAATMIFSMCACTNEATLGPDDDVIASLYDYELSEHVQLGQYNNIVVETRDPEATDDEINDALEQLQNKYAVRVEVKDRDTVQKGDILKIDYDGFIDGEAGNNMSADNQDLEIGSGTFIPGFEDALIGGKVGEKVTFDITFPDDYWNESMQSVKTTFEVTIHSISVMETPELNDAFIAEKTESETVEEYKTYLKAEITKSNQAEIDDDFPYNVWKQVLENATLIKCPDSLYQSLEELYNASVVSAAEQYGVTFEKYLELCGLTQEEYAKELDAQVLRAAKETLVLYAIAARENITLTWTQYQEKAKDYFEQMKVTTLEELETKLTREDVCGDIAFGMVLEKLEETARQEIKKEKEDN